MIAMVALVSVAVQALPDRKRDQHLHRVNRERLTTRRDDFSDHGKNGRDRQLAHRGVCVGVCLCVRAVVIVCLGHCVYHLPQAGVAP